VSDLKKKLLLMKLGGSVVSSKDKPFSYNEDLVSVIGSALSQHKTEWDYVLVHGGGSFGHPLAKKHRITEGLSGNHLGFCEVRCAMQVFPLSDFSPLRYSWDPGKKPN
jgi:isopentenyl phosphate kinase